MTTLHRYARPDVALGDLLRDVADIYGSSPAWVLLYSPKSAPLLRLDAKGTAVDADGQPASLETAFEARVFGEAAEVRWIKRNETGTAVLVSHEGIEREGFAAIDAIEATETLPQRYLLWGTVNRAMPGHDGWTALSEARIGGYHVPDVQLDGAVERVVMETVEYLAKDSHGNVFVAEERIVRLAAYTEEDA